jgi:hypothetical protein
MGYKLLKAKGAFHDLEFAGPRPVLNLGQGKPYGDRWPSIVMSVKAPWPTLDWFCYGSMDIVCERVATAIQSYEESVELLPLTLRGREESQEQTAYCVHALMPLPVLDLELSEYEEEYGNPIATVLRVALNEEGLAEAEAAGRAFFRIRDTFTTIFVVRDDLAEWLQQSGVTGIRVVNPEDWRFGARR